MLLEQTFCYKAVSDTLFWLILLGLCDHSWWPWNLFPLSQCNCCKPWLHCSEPLVKQKEVQELLWKMQCVIEAWYLNFSFLVEREHLDQLLNLSITIWPVTDGKSVCSFFCDVDQFDQECTHISSFVKLNDRLLKTYNFHGCVLRVMMWKHWVVVFSVVCTEKCISSHVAVVRCTGMQ